MTIKEIWSYMDMVIDGNKDKWAKCDQHTPMYRQKILVKCENVAHSLYLEPLHKYQTFAQIFGTSA